MNPFQFIDKFYWPIPITSDNRASTMLTSNKSYVQYEQGNTFKIFGYCSLAFKPLSRRS